MGVGDDADAFHLYLSFHNCAIRSAIFRLGGVLRVGFVELRARKALGQELLLGEMPDVVVSVFIALAVARLVHQAGRGVAQV